MQDNGAASSTAACSTMMKACNVFLTHPVLDACAYSMGHCCSITSQSLLDLSGVLWLSLGCPRVL